MTTEQCTRPVYLTMLEQYMMMRNELCSAVSEGNGALLTSYEGRKGDYFGGIFLFPKQQPRVLDYGTGLRARLHACEEEVPGEWPSWRTKVTWNTDVLIDTGNARKALLFRINDATDFTINGLAYCAHQYECSSMPSDFHPRPFFRPEFAGPIGRALNERRIKLVYPENADELAIRHLNVQKKL